MNAQLHGVEAAIAMLSRHPSPQDAWSECWKNLREKVLVNVKTQSAGMEFVINVAEATRAKPVIEEIAVYLDKQNDSKKGGAAVKGNPAKQSTACLIILRQLIKEFGTARIDTGLFLSKAQKFGISTDKPVKEALYDLLYEIFLWKRSVELVKYGLEDKQKAEIERRCATAPEEMPTATRKFKGEKEVAVPSSHSADGGESTREQFAMDIVTALGSVDKWEKGILEAEKWQEKRDKLQDLITLCEKAEKIKPHQDIAHIASLLLRLIKMEGNLVVVSMSLKAYGLLALGVRKEFGSQCKQAVQSVVAKLRDKNRSILQSAVTALDAFLSACPFDAFMEDCEKNLRDKSGPRQQLLDFCFKALTHPSQIQKKEKNADKFLQFCSMVIDDPNQTVRYSATKLLYAVEEVVGPQRVNVVLEGLQPKVRKMVEGFDLKRCTSSSSISGTTLHLGSPSLQPSLNEPKTPVKAPRKASDAMMSSGGARSPRTAASNASNLAAATDVLLESNYDFDEAEGVISGIMPHEIGELLKSSVWKDKVEGLEGLREWWEANTSLANPHAEPLVVYVKHVLKDFKENNLHVYRVGLTLLLTLPQLLGYAFSKTVVATVLRPITEKLVDQKLGVSVSEVVLMYSESFSPQFSLNVMLPTVKQSSNSVCSASYRDRHVPVIAVIIR
eukprot:GHVN01051786.1.p1 GENE.GHVN01051786.1~~GHVN01051786.1.p1  ORF type:complete len:671 (+),score=150.78 GHVN01051786.1:206-2218(+)